MLNKITAEGNRNLFISSHVFKIFEPFLHHLKLCKSAVSTVDKEILSYLFIQSTDISISFIRESFSTKTLEFKVVTDKQAI